MTGAISAVSRSVSGGIFSARRTNTGVDTVAENPVQGIMNFDIAMGQCKNAVCGVGEVAKGFGEGSLSMKYMSAEEALKTMSQGDKVIKGVANVVNFTADHINPLICAAGAAKVAFSKPEKRESVAIQEATALGTMFAFEGAAKNLLELPKITKVNGEKVVQSRTSVLRGTQMYEKFQPFLQKQKEAITDYCTTKESLQKIVKYAPGVAKGIAFAGASITGYALGSILGKKIAEAVEENKQEKARIVSMNQNKEKEVNIAQKEYRQSA